MANPFYPNLVPLGKIVVTTAGTPVLLSINCGPQQGQVTTGPTPPLSGQPFRGIVLTAPASGNTGNVILLPNGKSKTDVGFIIAVIEPGQTVAIPYGVLQNSGIAPENYVLDADTSGNFVYGYGHRG